jgi:alpha-1,3/alpha-1,6-mannosyltransferase
MLLAQHTTWLRRLYRAPLNWIEETTTGMADSVLVNSEFTASTFGSTFARLEARGLHPAVLYPAVDFHQFDTYLDNPPDVAFLPAFSAEGRTFLSINRFEKKKNIGLAISAFATLVRQQENSQLTSVPRQLVRLVVAGGYDKRLAENREYLQELKTLATEEGVVEQVIFVPSCSTLQRNALLAACICVLYTPMNEHFGIVPLEAMAAQRPVVACNSGGPKESIQHAKTGYLCESTPESFASAMALILQDSSRAEIMGKNARKHVEECFSRQVFGERLNSIIYDLLKGSL